MRQKLDAEGFGGVKADVGRDFEKIELGKAGGIVGAKIEHAPVLLVEETGRDIALDQLETIKDAAPHIARPLEAVGAPAKKKDRLFARLQPFGQLCVFAGAKKAEANGGHADKGRVHVDEGVFRVAFFRAVYGTLVAGGGEGGVDLADVEGEPPDGTVARKRCPILRFGLAHVDLAGRSLGGVGGEAAKAKGAGHFQPAAHEAVVDHHDGDRGA